MSNVFVPYRCEDCIYGVYNPLDSCWDDDCSAETDEECQEKFVEVKKK